MRKHPNTSAKTTQGGVWITSKGELNTAARHFRSEPPRLALYILLVMAMCCPKARAVCTGRIRILCERLCGLEGPDPVSMQDVSTTIPQERGEPHIGDISPINCQIKRVHRA